MKSNYMKQGVKLVYTGKGASVDDIEVARHYLVPGQQYVVDSVGDVDGYIYVLLDGFTQKFNPNMFDVDEVDRPPRTTKYVLHTLCYGHQQMTFINTPRQEAVEAFMNEFGEEPNEVIAVYTDGEFEPKDIKGRTSICHYDD